MSDQFPTPPDDQINTDDIPEVQDWSGARRGVFYRPLSIEAMKEARQGNLTSFKSVEELLADLNTDD